MIGGESSELLEALGLQPELPAPRFFSELVRRFVRLVPVETLTSRPDHVREPEEVFASYVETGNGCAGLERARAFFALAKALAFDVERLAGVRDDGTSHEALFATVGGRRFLADVSFPLPEPLAVGAP